MIQKSDRALTSFQNLHEVNERMGADALKSAVEGMEHLWLRRAASRLLLELPASWEGNDEVPSLMPHESIAAL